MNPIKPTAEHPRQHALTIAAAQHLHSAGHISESHRDEIHNIARKKLDAHKAKKKILPPPMMPFGSIAPAPSPMLAQQAQPMPGPADPNAVG